ncbi:unnamed protein product [Fusarium graminearum]|nr:unnamed protein product [Fusarium graminearum]
MTESIDVEMTDAFIIDQNQIITLNTVEAAISENASETQTIRAKTEIEAEVVVEVRHPFPRISRTGSGLQGCREDVRGSHVTRVNNDYPHYPHRMVHRLMLLNTGSFRIAVESISPQVANHVPSQRNQDFTTDRTTHHFTCSALESICPLQPLISCPSPSLRAVNEILGPAVFGKESHSPKSTMLRTSKRR